MKILGGISSIGSAPISWSKTVESANQRISESAGTLVHFDQRVVLPCNGTLMFCRGGRKTPKAVSSKEGANAPDPKH